MSKNKLPWLKFYPQDWLGEKSLRFCSPGARGLWIDMLCIMHESGGYLLNDLGQPVTDRMLVALTGIDESTLTLLKGELENNGVFSANNKGVIYSRRMVNDVQKAKKLQKNGKNGGNPKLCKQKIKSTLDNQSVNQEDKPQKPEARSQKERKKEEPPPDGVAPPLIFEGHVVRLNARDWPAWRDEFSLTDEQLGRFMCERDDWLKTLDADDRRRERWWAPTRQWLLGETENLKKSTR